MLHEQCQILTNNRPIQQCGVTGCCRFAQNRHPLWNRLCSTHYSRLNRRDMQGLPDDERYQLLLQTPTVMPTLATFNIEKVKKRICEPSTSELIRPLFLFKGSTTEGRMLSLYNLLASAKDNEVKTLREISAASEYLVEPVHYCGFHRLIANQSLLSICSRILQSPSVLKAELDWYDYIHYVVENSEGWLLNLIPIPPTSFDWHISRTRPWRYVAPPRKDRQPRERITEYYPYIKGPVLDDHALLVAVDKLVPKGYNDDTRADICQDMIVAILTGETTLENMAADKAKYVKGFFKQFPSKYGPLSLDAPIIWGNDVSDMTIGDTIAQEYRS